MRCEKGLASCNAENEARLHTQQCGRRKWPHWILPEQVRPRSSLRRRLCGSKRKSIPSTTGREQYYLFLCILTAGFNPSSRQSLHDGIVKLHRSVASVPISTHWLFIGGLAEHRCESSFVPSSRQSSRETLALCPSNFGAEPIKIPRSSLCCRCSSMF